MKLNRCFIVFFLFLASCSKQSVDITKCETLKKTSKEYVLCMKNLMESSNTAANVKEFKKHSTLSSFFKQVEVIISD